MRAQLDPRSVDWYAYKSNERPAQEAVAAGLRARTRTRLRAGRHRDDSGRIRRDRARLALVPTARRRRHPGAWVVPLRADAARGNLSRRAALDPTTSRSTSMRSPGDHAAHAVVIVNSPSNPTGRVFLADVGRARHRPGTASRAHGRRIWLLSDEPYRRIRFDGIAFASPAGSYPWTMIDYSYGKVLLAPGQRGDEARQPCSQPPRPR